MRIVNLDQHSDEWLLWRERGIGGSDAGVLWFGEYWGRTLADLYKEKTRDKTLKKRPKTAAMQRGIDLEPLIRSRYENFMDVRAEPVCAHHDDHEWLKASFDGWIPRLAIAVEYKAPNNADHGCALDGEVPAKYLAQLLHLCLVSGSRRVHYVSYSDRFEAPDDFAMVPFTPQEADLRKLFDLEQEFWAKAESARKLARAVKG